MIYRKTWKIFILHSLISTEEQQLIFKPVEDQRKIILSTNIAESSITVPDVRYGKFEIDDYFEIAQFNLFRFVFFPIISSIVIDFCLMKYLRCDPSKNFTSLEMDWAAKNNCKQRAGRAGRVANGRCYRMVFRKFFEVCIIFQRKIEKNSERIQRKSIRFHAFLSVV